MAAEPAAAAAPTTKNIIILTKATGLSERVWLYVYGERGGKCGNETISHIRVQVRLCLFV